MHMADALISPAVGGTLWAATGVIVAGCMRSLKRNGRDDQVPLMGVLGAFVFTAQMINFAIPGTGSSGHLGGGLLLAILLGPSAAVLTIASVLAVQALFFGDGGLLAMGCNIVNLGFFPAFIAYPLIYRPLARTDRQGARFWAAAVLSAIVGLQLGSLAVVLETRASGLSELPFDTFLLLMQPIHLAIGIVEGVATASIVAVIVRLRPEIARDTALPVPSLKPVLLALLLAAAVTGGLFSHMASASPDGLEWSVARATSCEEIAGQETPLHRKLAQAQQKTAVMPDYTFSHPDAPTGTSVAGLAGGLATLVLAGLAGLAFAPRKKATP